MSVKNEYLYSKYNTTNDTMTDEKKSIFNATVNVNADLSELIPFLKKCIVHSPEGWDNNRVDDALNLLAVSMVMEENKVKFPINFDDVVNWLDMRKDSLKRTLTEYLRLDIDYVILILCPQDSISDDKSNRKTQHGGVNKDTIMLTVRSAMKLCLLSKSKGAAVMTDFLLDIMDMFKAGIRDPSNSIFNKIRKCVGIKMDSVPDYSVKNPTLPECRHDITSGRMVIKHGDLSNNPLDTMRALRMYLGPDQHSTYYDVAQASATFMIVQYNEKLRLKAHIDEIEDELNESQIDVECARRELDKATGITETQKYKNIANQLRIQVDSLSLLVAAKIEKLEPRAAAMCMNVLHQATSIVSEYDVEELGNAVVQASIFSATAQSKESSRIKKILDNVVGILAYSHTSSYKRVDMYCTQQEQKINTYYFEELECYDDEPLNLAFLSKLVKKVDKRTRDAVYKYAIDNFNTLPITLSSVVKNSIDLYYGDSGFAPYLFPTGEVEYGREILVYLSRGPIFRPVDHNLVYGGRIMTTSVNKAMTAIKDEFKDNVWACNIVGYANNVYTVKSYIAFMKTVAGMSQVSCAFLRNNIGAWSTL
jgi:hypothetical protein